jgi:hypothetical protein
VIDPVTVAALRAVTQRIEGIARDLHEGGEHNADLVAMCAQMAAANSLLMEVVDSVARSELEAMERIVRFTAVFDDRMNQILSRLDEVQECLLPQIPSDEEPSSPTSSPSGSDAEAS